MKACTVAPAAEVRRLRAELAEAHRLIAEIADAIDPVAEAEYRHRMAAEAYGRGREDGWAAGYIACVEDWKASEHAAVESAWLVAAHFRTIRWPDGDGKAKVQATDFLAGGATHLGVRHG